MKCFIWFLFIFFPIVTYSQEFFLASYGSDEGDGSLDHPWKTLSMLNSKFAANEIPPGSFINFNKDDLFYGKLNINVPRITLQAYGKGYSRPIITGYIQLDVDRWEHYEGNIWMYRLYESPQTDYSQFLMVTNDFEPLEMGRYPNPNENEPSENIKKGYLTYNHIQPLNNLNDAQAIPSGYLYHDPLPSSFVLRNPVSDLIRQKTEICARITDISMVRYRIVEDDMANGERLKYTSAVAPINYGYSIHPAMGKYGYYFQNNINFLDRNYEWYFDSEQRRLYMYFEGNEPPSDHKLHISGVRNFIELGTQAIHFTAKDIFFDGAHEDAIKTSNLIKNIVTGPNVRIENCKFRNIGSRALHFFRTNEVVVNNCEFSNCLSSAIQVYSLNTSSCTITGCDLSNIAPYPGMSCHYDPNGDNAAIHIAVSSKLVIANNVINNVGRSGIHWQGSNVNISNNIILNTMKYFSDCGAIYTYWGTGDNTYNNRFVTNNIIGNVFGNIDGTNASVVKGNGIYLDDLTKNVYISNNTVYNASHKGIQVNTGYNIILDNNTLYNNGTAIGFAIKKRDVNLYSISNSTNLYPTIVSSRNILYSPNDYNNNFYYENDMILENMPFENVLLQLGHIDKNYYSVRNSHPFAFECYNSNTPGVRLKIAPRCFTGWRTLTAQDWNSNSLPDYKLYKEVANISNQNNYSNSLENNNDLVGANGLNIQATSIAPSIEYNEDLASNCLRVEQNNPQANSYLRIMPRTSRTIDLSKKYMLRLKTFGTTYNGQIKVYIRTGGIYNNVNNWTPITTVFSNDYTKLGVVNHEFLLIPDLSLLPDPALPPVSTSPQTLNSCNFVIDIEQTSGTTFIDDIEFTEVTADITDISDFVKFIPNTTRDEITYDLTESDIFAEADGTEHWRSIVIPPFESKLLFKRVSGDQLASRFFASKTTKEKIRSELQTKTNAPAVSCYPNPANKKINISNLKSEDQWDSFDIIDLNGKLLKNLSLNRGINSFAIDVSTYPDGFYFIRLKNKMMKSLILKFEKL